jgi:peptide/nickel transport system permease protein
MLKSGTLRLVQIIQQYIIGVFIFIIIGSLPVLLRDLTFDIEGYLASIKGLSIKIFTLSSLTYDGEHELLPAVMDRYFYSLKTLSVSFIFSVILAFILSYILVLFLKNKKDYVLSFIEIIRTVPDIVGIFLLQSIFIWINKEYGVKLVQTVSLGSENQAFLLPLLSLSLPIFLFLTQVIVLKIFEELDKQYVDFAKAKGLSFFYLLNVHVLRNIMYDLLSHLKTIIWMMLSTLVMVEYIFNMDGLMMFNIKHITIELFVFSCILFFTPFFTIYRLIDLRGRLGR